MTQNPEDARVRGVAVVVPTAVLVLVAGRVLLSAHERVGAVAVAGFVLVGALFAVRAGYAALCRRLPFGGWLLAAQAVLTFALLVANGWSWHGTGGLLAGALLLAGGWGVAVAVVLTVAVPPTAWALALEPGQLLHWLLCHMAVALLVWALARLTSLVRAQWRDRREAVQNARERERAQVGLVLHDVLGRSLIAIALRGEAVHGRIGEDQGLRAEVRSLIDLAREARAEVRTAVATPWRTTVVNDGAPVRESPVVHGMGLRGVVARCLAVEGGVRVGSPSPGVFALTCRVPVG